jgi:hypothetical protein
MTDLATTIEAAVRAVPGVVGMFSAEPAGALKMLTGSGSLVAVSERGATDDTPVRITVSVGVDGTLQAPTTAAEIAAVIRSLAPAGADISVRISRVSS